MGLGSEIRDPEKTYSGSRSRGQKGTDPGSGSAALPKSRLVILSGRIKNFLGLEELNVEEYFRIPSDLFYFHHCCGSMTFWGGSGSGSGSADSCLWVMDPDPGSGSCYFRHWPRCQQKTNFLTQFFCLFLFEATFTSFFKDKKSKRVTK